MNTIVSLLVAVPDLTNIPGIPELWTQTYSDSRITIVRLDGSVDLERVCFSGTNPK